MNSVATAVINLLARIGLVTIVEYGAISWPVRVLPWWLWRARWWPAVGKRDPIIGLFRNRPGIVKWVPGRLLPRRWGFWIFGLEIGDRGGASTLYLRTAQVPHNTKGTTR